MSFYNRRYFTRQKFEIDKSNLKVDRKNMFDETEYEIPYDYIHNKMKVQTIVNNNGVILGIFFIVFSLLFLIGDRFDLTAIFSAFGFIGIIASFINRKKVISIGTMDGSVLELYFTNSNKDEVVDFAHQIIEASNAYLLKKHSKIDRSLPIDPQIESIQYLLNREVISEETFESLKNQLLGKENVSSIGFTHK